MLDIGWSELLVIGAVALIVVGPKELPKLLRTVGQFVGKARSMAREFQRSMDEAAREGDLKELTDLKRDFDKMGRVDFKDQAKRSSESLKAGGRKPGAPVLTEDKSGTAAVASGDTAKTGPAEAAEPKTAKPATAKPATAKPDTPHSDTKPKTAEPKTAKPEPAEPASSDTAQPSAQPDAEAPRAASGDR